MILCSNCGTENKDNSILCPKCGCKIKKVSRVNKNNPIIKIVATIIIVLSLTILLGFLGLYLGILAIAFTNVYYTTKDIVNPTN